ncbi:MAG: pilus assembly protein N-terminal domain-containing protein, partial [Bryobacteraceae bacterium]
MTRLPRVCWAVLAVRAIGIGQVTPPPTSRPAASTPTAVAPQSSTISPAAGSRVAMSAPAHPQSPPVPAAPSASHLTLGLYKSIVIDEPAGILRIAVSNSDIAEAVAVSASEAMINGKAPGVTSLVIWLSDGTRKVFDLAVEPGTEALDAVQAALGHELTGQDIHLSIHGGSVFLTGLALDLESADRAVQMAAVLGKVVNLLQIKLPDGEPQILLRVRFANIDRGATSNLGINLFSTPNSVLTGATTTGQYGVQPAYDFTQHPPTTALTNLLNIFLYQPNINLGAVVSALEAKQLAQVLAEPNLLTLSGHRASFLAGGQFPYPTIQGGANGIGQVTIQFRDFGIRLNFLPRVTLRGT